MKPEATKEPMRLADLTMWTCVDGHHVLIYHRQRIIAMLGPMGSDVESLHVERLGWVPVEKLIWML